LLLIKKIYLVITIFRAENNECVNLNYFQTIEAVKDKSTLPKLFQSHGTQDELVLPEWGDDTYKQLTKLGLSTEFHRFNIYHEMNLPEINMLRNWILKLIPDDTSLL
jgi:predicted esterase